MNNVILDCICVKARLPCAHILETTCQRLEAANHAIRSTDILCGSSKTGLARDSLRLRTKRSFADCDRD
jgi:hypothetical protein